jgi:hypothetical protein
LPACAEHELLEIAERIFQIIALAAIVLALPGVRQRNPLLASMMHPVNARAGTRFKLWLLAGFLRPYAASRSDDI